MFNSFNLENHGTINSVMGVNNGTASQGCNTVNATAAGSNRSITIANGSTGNPAEAVTQYRNRITDRIIGLDLPADVMITVLRAIHKERET